MKQSKSSRQDDLPMAMKSALFIDFIWWLFEQMWIWGGHFFIECFQLLVSLFDSY